MAFRGPLAIAQEFPTTDNRIVAIRWLRELMYALKDAPKAIAIFVTSDGTQHAIEYIDSGAACGLWLITHTDSYGHMTREAIENGLSALKRFVEFTLGYSSVSETLTRRIIRAGGFYRN